MAAGSLFDVQDIVGGGSSFCIHQSKTVVAYEVGCGLIIWDLITDQKIKLHNHATIIQDICFASHDDRLVCSVDGGANPTLFVTEWESMRRIQQFTLPVKSRPGPIESTMLRYSYQSNILGLLENESGGGYRLMFWEIKNNLVNLLFLNEIEQTASCINLLFFETIKGGLQLAVVEKHCIKYWKFEAGRAVLTNRIYVKSAIVSASISRLTNLLCFVDEFGRGVFVNSVGNMVDTISHQKECFASVFVDDIFAYFGTQSGALCIYHLNTFRLNAVYPYLYSLRKKFTVSSESMTEGMSGPAINKVFKSHMSNLLAWTHADGSLVVFDNEKKKVIEYQLSHAKRIESLKWVRGKRDSFISCASDGYAMIWELVNEKWTPKILDVSSKISIEMSSTFYYDKNPNPAKSEDEVINRRESFSVRSVEMNYHKNELLVGDMMGTLSVYDCEDYRLSRKLALGKCGIEDLCVSPKGSVLGVALSSGEAFLCDCSRNYQKILVLENPFDDYTLKSSGVFKHLRLIQDELERSTIFEYMSENRSSVGMNKSAALAKSQYQKYYIKTETAMKAVTVHNSNTLRLQQVYRDDLTISASPKIVYCIDGKCTSFEVHPSNDYLVAVSNIGFLYLFKLVNGDMRMKVNVPAMSSNLFLDPSGLYCFMSCHEAEDPATVYNVAQKAGRTELFVDKEVDLMVRNPAAANNTKVLMVEIGTGQRAGSVSNLFDISAGCFAESGNYMVLGSSTGHIGIWALSRAFADNIGEVLEQMRLNPKFWNEFPINIADDQEFAQEDSSDSDVTMDPQRSPLDFNSKATSLSKAPAAAKPSQPIRIGSKLVSLENKPRDKPKPDPVPVKHRHRFFEEKASTKDHRKQPSTEGNLEKKFTRYKDGPQPLVLGGRNLADRSDQSSSSSSQASRYRIPREVLQRDHNNSRQNQTDEINRRLEILKLNAQKQLKDTELFNKSKDDMDHEIGPEPNDIDETEGDGRSETSTRKQQVFEDIGKFEKRFDRY